MCPNKGTMGSTGGGHRVGGWVGVVVVVEGGGSICQYITLSHLLDQLLAISLTCHTGHRSCCLSHVHHLDPRD